MRTAQTLPKGDFEVTGGVVCSTVVPSVTVIGAYGLTNDVELEGRCERFSSVSFGPRFQWIDGGDKGLSMVAFTHIGIDANSETCPFFGAGLTTGFPFGESEAYWTIAARTGRSTGLFGVQNTEYSAYTGIGYRRPTNIEKIDWVGEMGLSYPGGVELALGIGYRF